MDDAAFVRGLECLRDLRGDRQGVAQRHGAFGEPIRERRSLDELEDERRHAIDIFESVDRADVRMIE